MRDGKLTIEIVRGDDEETIISAVMMAAAARSNQPGTTVVVAPECSPNDFVEYLNYVTTIEEDLLPTNKLDGIVQVAPFHPLFEFADSDGVDTLTNKSPFPIFHILREEEVSRAVQKLDGDASKVWQRNVDLLEYLEDKLGTDTLEKAVAAPLDDDESDVRLQEALQEFRRLGLIDRPTDMAKSAVAPDSEPRNEPRLSSTPDSEQNEYVTTLHEQLGAQLVDATHLHEAAMRVVADPSVGYDSAFGKPAIKTYLAFWKRYKDENMERNDVASAAKPSPAILSAARNCAQQITFLRKQHQSREAEWVRHNDKARDGRTVFPLILLLDNVRSAFNVGSLFRTADACGCAKVITTGITPHPDGGGAEKLSKSALGAERFVPSQHFDTMQQAVDYLRKERPGWALVGMETTERSVVYTEYKYPGSTGSSNSEDVGTVLVLGNEVTGVDTDILPQLDAIVEIPMFGAKNSLNIAACAPVVAYEALRQWECQANDDGDDDSSDSDESRNDKSNRGTSEDE